MQKNNWTFKDKLEILEAIFTIVVSVMAIWGTLVAWENGFWRKLDSVVDHLHHEYHLSDDFRSAEQDLSRMIEKVEKMM